MDESQILESLLELAAEAGMRVRMGGGVAPEENLPPLASGVCRLRGELWVVLSSRESPAVQIEALASALRDHAGSLLESRHLPPAIRNYLEPPPGA
jgi:hypothetical protein